MKETAGKAATREYFYRVFLPSVLSPRLLSSSNYLVLLGENFREMELLAELNVPPYRVHSVERDKRLYDKQRVTNQREDFGVALHYGELEEYLRSYLYSDLKFGVFNLDICGSYLRGIDLAMGEILLFARRNPRSVIATYSSAGRDRLQLQEGLKSLAFLLWLNPAATYELVESLYDQYSASDLFQKEKSRGTVSKNMVLRYLFWLRSHLEHIALGSYMLGHTSVAPIRRLMEIEEKVWDCVVKQRKFPLDYKQLRRLADKAIRHTVPGVSMDLAFSDIQTATYAADGGFYQNCFFATFESSEKLMGLEEWADEAVKVLMGNPVLMIDREGQNCRTSSGKITPRFSTEDVVVWEKHGLSLDTRHLAIPPVASSPVPDPDTEDQQDREEVSKNGSLNEQTIAQIKRLATAGHDSKTIVEQLGLEQKYKNSVVAYVAVARRAAKPSESQSSERRAEK